MSAFYCFLKNVGDGRIRIIDQEQVHHIRDVLRLELKEETRVFDELGNCYRARVEEILPEQVVFSIIHKQEYIPKGPKLVIACAIPKKSNMDDIIDKLTQLGVDEIIPMETERVIVRLDEAKKENKLERWQKIAFSASQQSQRNILPVIKPVTGINEVILSAQGMDLKLIPNLMEKSLTLKEVLNTDKKREIIVLIGPEGDFTAEEVDLAKSKGFICVSLGDSVLRVETAALAAAAFIKLYEGRSKTHD